MSNLSPNVVQTKSTGSYMALLDEEISEIYRNRLCGEPSFLTQVVSRIVEDGVPQVFEVDGTTFYVTKESGSSKTEVHW